jgi:hypothetical protein
MTSSRSTVPLLGTVGALVFTGVGVLQTIDPTFAGEPAFAARNVPSAIGALLMAGLVVELHRSGAAGERRLVRLGLVAAALGWVVDAAAQLISQAMGVDYSPPYIVASVLLVFGMLPPGMAALWEGVWSGWRRWIPLATVIYLTAASPLLGAPGVPANLAGTGWGMIWLALGVALLTARQRTLFGALSNER